MATITGGTSECLSQDPLPAIRWMGVHASHGDIAGSPLEDTPAVGTAAGPGRLYVHQSIWKGTIWLLLCSRLRSQSIPEIGWV